MPSSRSWTTASGCRTNISIPRPSKGIGLRNVNERLRVIYGANYELKLHSVSGQGTSARIEIPELVVPERATA